MPQPVLRRSLLLMALVLATGGCSLFGGDEEANPPADLTDLRTMSRAFSAPYCSALRGISS